MDVLYKHIIDVHSRWRDDLYCNCKIGKWDRNFFLTSSQSTKDIGLNNHLHNNQDTSLSISKRGKSLIYQNTFICTIQSFKSNFYAREV